jgi:sortase A
MRRSGKIVRPVLRFIASVLITSGILMLVDAVLTVTWQEPVSAYIAQRQQDGLKSELTRDKPQVALDVQQLRSIPNPIDRLEKLAARSRKRARTGHAIGIIRIPRLGARYAVVQGTDTGSLRKGPGHFPRTSFPGEGGTVAIAGHRTTYLAPFRNVDELKRGDQILLEMPYGTFQYAVERTQVVLPTQTSVTKRVLGPERLVLTACHPLYSASHRIVVFARLSSATQA